MKRINTPTSSNGRFVDGNKALGTYATQFSAEWCNMVQEEICNLIKALTGAEPTGQSEEELKSAFMTYVAALGLKSIELHKTASGSNVLRKFFADGDGFDISIEGEGASDNSHAHFSRTGFYYEKSSNEPTRSYKVEVDSESVKVTDTNPGGTFTAEIKGGVIHIKRGNDGVEVAYDKVNTPNLFLTFDPKGRSSTGDLTQNASMSDFENDGTGVPTEYFVCANPGTQGYAGRDYFMLDSHVHTKGAVVMIRNVDSNYPIFLYREADTNREYPIAEIPPKGTKCVNYHGQVATGSGTGVTYVWDVM